MNSGGGPGRRRYPLRIPLSNELTRLLDGFFCHGSEKKWLFSTNRLNRLTALHEKPPLVARLT
ncbi:hypothetical protein BN2364_3862 [Alloalcanivorax xenomutans]|nr:hypothetical protein BN2364_3862 [Alloalcanivorax xenomutans]